MHRGPAPALRVRGFFVLVLLFTSCGLGSAHDLWMVAGKYRLAPRETTRVFINSGDAFPESLTLLGAHRVTSLVLHTPSARTSVSELRVDGKSLTFEVQAEEQGSHVIALGTRARRARLKAADFEDYLEENGLAAIQALREELGEQEEAAVESYAKWAKAIVDVGDLAPAEAEPAWSQPVGHMLEIVPERNPNRLSPGDELFVRVLYEGEPLPNASVMGGIAGGPPGQIKTTTDASGVASVTVPYPGRWYLRSIHMIRASDDPQVQWESFWCTLTFEIQEASP